MVSPVTVAAAFIVTSFTTFNPAFKETSLATVKPLFIVASLVTVNPAFNVVSPPTTRFDDKDEFPDTNNPLLILTSPPITKSSFNEISPKLIAFSLTNNCLKGFAAVPNVASLLEGTTFPPTVNCPPTPTAEFNETSLATNKPLLILTSPPITKSSFNEISPKLIAF